MDRRTEGQWQRDRDWDKDIPEGKRKTAIRAEGKNKFKVPPMCK